MDHTNPVYPDYFADPFVWKHDGLYYAVGTGREVDFTSGVFSVLRSRSLFDWEYVGPAMQALPPDYGDAYWAPEVAYSAGRFWLYYSVGRGDKAHHIRVASSEEPAGPYLDTGARITNPFHTPFAIDASPFQDDDGHWYLFYARDFLDTDRPGTALVVDRLIGMTELAGEEHIVLRARHDWQRFMAGRVMYGASYDWHTLEGPCVRKRNGRYYCFYSSGRWENDTYGVDFAVADQVTGPFVCESDTSGPRVLRTKAGNVIGPGHNSMVTGPDGVTDYMVYHAWDAQMSGRRMFLDPVEWTEAGPGIAL